MYEIQHRFDWRRRIVAGELPAIPPAADGSDYCRWLNLDPRTLDDRVLSLDFGMWLRSSSIELTFAQHPKLVTDSCRTEWELDLLDGDNTVVATRSGSVSLNYGQPSWEDSSISMDRRTARQLKFFELRGRTEARALAKLPVASIPA